MASKAKKRAVGNGVQRPLGATGRREEEEEEDEVEDEEEEDEDSEEEEDEDDEIVDEEVNIEFEAYSISDTDYGGIKKLLQQLFLKAPVNTAELANLLIQQNHIGSVIKEVLGQPELHSKALSQKQNPKTLEYRNIKQDDVIQNVKEEQTGLEQTDVSEDSDDEVDEDEIFGFISLLNLTERKGTQCAEQIKELVLSLCEKNCEQSVVEQLDKLLNDTSKPVGFLLSERFINVPPQIALPLHQQLQKELAEAQRTNQPCGKCCFYLLISKTFVEAAKSSSRKRRDGLPQEALMFANAEEEFFYEKAILKFSYSVQGESDTCLGGRWSFDDVPMKPFRTVMLIPHDRMSEIMETLKDHLSI